MKAEEKISAAVHQLERLAEQYGEFTVRRAAKRWARESLRKKYQAKVRLERLVRSVWAPAFRRGKA